MCRGNHITDGKRSSSCEARCATLFEGLEAKYTLFRRGTICLVLRSQCTEKGSLIDAFAYSNFVLVLVFS